MNEFAPDLRELSARLDDLPWAVRSRILLEMASDLEAVRDHYRETGLPREEAVRRAREQVLASPDVVRELVRVHAGGHGGLLARFAGRLQRGFTAFFLVAGVLPLLAIAAFAAVPQVGDIRQNPALWPVLAAGVAIAVVVLVNVARLYPRRERSPRRLRSGLPALLFLGILSPAIGATGFLVGLRGTLIRISETGARTIPPEIMPRFAQDAALLSVSLLLMLAAGLAWFILARRVAAIEREESAYLLDEPPP